LKKLARQTSSESPKIVGSKEEEMSETVVRIDCHGCDTDGGTKEKEYIN